ncbi:tRNA (guanosine(46)-N7)-methyltransferase TrmB [Fusobacterium massiliense]|uniref:tRNA (guanosine(46)-N7)-methyltransferase TrmB n=1 Tax=Fusobacterium massiliense TaxID=1852365 RepID=UPI0028D471E3|nr:tRNA (guanosine(46)-N7)-methyltransferase TrmB [Fusobacterium massiliense]
MYNLLRNVALALYKPFMNDKMKSFIDKRLKQDFSDLKKEDYIWIHCSSVGEVNLSEDLVNKFYSISRKNILISVFTDTGYENAVKKYSAKNKIKVIYFPIDDKDKIQEILKKINLQLLVLVETELWPNLINEVNKNKSRIVIVNGRISDRSYPRYKKMKFLLKSMLGKIDYFYMQSEIDKNRIIDLGASNEKVENIGNLKFSISLEKYSDEEKKEYKEFLNILDRKIFVAGSTRTGENEIILNVFEKLKNTVLIIVPRHLENVDKIINLIDKSNLSFIKYSEIEKGNTNKKDIIVVDKMGVLRKLYSISDIAFVGGTLVNIGGHNLLEPLFYRKKPIFGKYTQNVTDISEEILKRNIGFQVQNESEFLEAINSLEKNNNNDEINNFFEENKFISLNIVKKENFIMRNDNLNENLENEKKDLWKHFFHSEKSNYNIYMYKLLDYPEYIIYDSELMKEKKGKWNQFFKNDNPIALEIGTGSGNFMRQLAERNPNKNFIGLELRFKRLVLSAEKCKKRAMKNVALLRKRGEEIEEFLGKNEISEMYINFPDPWEGTEKNRIIQESLFKTLDNIMKKDGILYFKTDHDVYYSDVLDLVKTLENYEVIYHTSDLHNSEKAENNIKTEFEQLFLHKYNKNINYIEIKKMN